MKGKPMNDIGSDKSSNWSPMFNNKKSLFDLMGKNKRLVKEKRTLLEKLDKCKEVLKFYANKEYTVGGWQHWELPEKAIKCLKEVSGDKE